MDANLLHISFEGRHLEDPSAEAEESRMALDGFPGSRAGRRRAVDLESSRRAISFPSTAPA